MTLKDDGLAISPVHIRDPPVNRVLDPNVIFELRDSETHFKLRFDITEHIQNTMEVFLTEEEIMQRKKRVEELLRSAYSSDKDHLSDFPNLAHYNTNGLSLYLESGRGNKLSSDLKNYIQKLLKVNMEGPYGAEWAAEEKVKRREMSSSEALYIFVYNKESIIGFVHYRFTIEEEIPVLYVYELQLEPAYQGKGLGKFLMQLVELIACNNRMGAVVLTVQKRNTSAINFYLNRLRCSYETGKIAAAADDSVVFSFLFVVPMGYGGYHRSRSVGRDRKYRRDYRDRDGRAGLGRSRSSRGVSRVKEGFDDDFYGNEQRGPTTRFYNTNCERFPHGKFDEFGVFHEFEYAGMEGDHANPGDWEKVTYRKAKFRSKTPIRSNVSRDKFVDNRWDDVDKWSSTIFVTNFPSGTTRKGLWDRCSKVGKVLDVFISAKESVVGKRFAFVRFAKGLDISNIIYRIRNLWIGSFRLFADVSKFKRGDKGVNKVLSTNGKEQVRMEMNEVCSQTSEPKKHVSWATPTEPPSEAAMKPGVPLASVKGGMTLLGKDRFGVQDVVKEKFVIGNDKQVPIDNFKSSLLLMVRDIKSMSKLYHLASMEGFDNVSFRYVGGWWVRVDCNTSEESAKFANCKAFKSIFSAIKRVTSDFWVKERMIWLGISGLPLGAWSSEVFSDIASLWGKVCFVDNDLEEPLAVGKVCVLTPSPTRISENIVCELGGKCFDVVVTEQQFWTPCFDVPEDSDDDSFIEEDASFQGDNNVDCEGEKVFREACHMPMQEERAVATSVVDPMLDPNTNSGGVEKDPVIQGETGYVNSDPFGIMDFLEKQFPAQNKSYSVSLSVPPGFQRIENLEDEVTNMGKEVTVETPVCDFAPTKIDIETNQVNSNGAIFEMLDGEGTGLASTVDIGTSKKVNMEGPYGAEWAAEEKVKRREMSSSEALYIFVYNKESIIGFVHYRFTIEEEIPVLYVYELQLEPAYQGKGLGKFLMQLVELIACNNRMGAVVLTVQKRNTSAINFYLNRLRYNISSISPSKVYQLMGVIGLEKSYEILCKTFDHEAKATLEVICFLADINLFSVRGRGIMTSHKGAAPSMD
ncbi:hypothetical protein SSX86_008273 [Deinandra increscens subsp. villosa]|uniref:N-alpha-acetyltransferase 40 n=1 Tax=Deinandra increscens subsp. villosa TaxID=3103831 RepID=A0AAP0DIU0_9ASTR